MKALVVEDDAVSSQLLVSMLEFAFECDIAENGEIGLEAFTAASKNGSPYDLVCLDIMMPVMDGQQMLKEIRCFEAENGIDGLDGAKIIMTTALDSAQSIFEAFREQCESYLVKPFDVQALKAEIEKLGL